MCNKRGSQFDIFLAMAIGVLLGILFSVGAVDDLDKFTIPFTDKVFVREGTQGFDRGDCE